MAKEIAIKPKATAISGVPSNIAPEIAPNNAAIVAIDQITAIIELTSFCVIDY